MSSWISKIQEILSNLEIVISNLCTFEKRFVGPISWGGAAIKPSDLHFEETLHVQSLALLNL